MVIDMTTLLAFLLMGSSAKAADQIPNRLIDYASLGKFYWIRRLSGKLIIGLPK